MFSWSLFAAALAVVGFLILKLFLMKKDLNLLCAEFGEHLSSDTNTLLSVSSGDRQVRALAAQLNQQLRQLQALRQTYEHGDREIKDAVTSISHDLRTPLTAICGYLELLKREEMPDNAARYLSYIENRTTAMKTLTEELFQYSVILSSNSDFPLEPVNLGVILEESIAGFYAPLVQRGITPVIRICEQKVIRPLNVNALSRIFGNILNNALKYSDGDLEITLSNTGEIVFTNTASKLDEVEVSRLFDRFYSVESVRNSTGLGLSIAKLLTRQLDGTINARYSEGRLAIVLRF